MSIRVPCSGCGNNLKAPDHLAGKRVRCPACQTLLRVPAPVARPWAPPPSPPLAALPQPTDDAIQGMPRSSPAPHLPPTPAPGAPPRPRHRRTPAPPTRAAEPRRQPEPEPVIAADWPTTPAPRGSWRWVSLGMLVFSGLLIVVGGFLPWASLEAPVFGPVSWNGF